jgi:UPF0755 protein
LPYKILGGVVLVLVCSGLWAWLDYRAAIATPLVTGNPVLIEIEKGDSFQRITDKLQAQQLPINAVWFKILALQDGAFKKLKTGEYEITAGFTLQDILAVLVSGKTKHYALTFPEGWCFKQILQAIADDPHIEHSLKKPADIDALAVKLGAEHASPEGLLFPDTYFFEKHTTDMALLQRAYAKMQAILQQEWAKKAEGLPFKNSYEALIMASIIEKETGAKAERAMIAGVFIRRLQQAMRLQTDPTVIYGMGERYQGDITYQDLKTPTPYNTYLIKGLPPTPIAMPGRDAIIAALHPDNTDNLYFVARGDGSHIFSASLTAHNAAVDHFQRKKK